MKVRVKDVDVEAVTTPTAPLLRVTTLADGVSGSNPVPVIERVGALAASFAALAETVGLATTVATCSGAPLETPKDVTTTVSSPVLSGSVENVTLREVDVTDDTVPTAPRLRATAFADGDEGSKPMPVTSSVPDAESALLSTLLVISGPRVPGTPCGPWGPCGPIGPKDKRR